MYFTFSVVMILVHSLTAFSISQECYLQSRRLSSSQDIDRVKDAL